MPLQACTTWPILLDCWRCATAENERKRRGEGPARIHDAGARQHGPPLTDRSWQGLDTLPKSLEVAESPFLFLLIPLISHFVLSFLFFSLILVPLCAFHSFDSSLLVPLLGGASCHASPRQLQQTPAVSACMQASSIHIITSTRIRGAARVETQQLSAEHL